VSESSPLAITALTVPLADAELGADRLMMAGAFAVEERETGSGKVELRAPLGDQPDTVAARLGTLPAEWAWRIELVSSEPLDTWREFVAPIAIADDLVLRPAWLPALETGTTEVVIEPGAAFGLGDHPTTRLSASATWRLTRPGMAVLDVGCGTGVLAVVAALAGATAVMGIDIAEAAVQATRDNAARNGVGMLIEASTAPLSDVSGRFNLVLANVLAPILIEMAADLIRVLADDATLVLSGLITGRWQHVVDALTPLYVVRVDELDGWVAIELSRPT